MAGLEGPLGIDRAAQELSKTPLIIVIDIFEF